MFNPKLSRAITELPTCLRVRFLRRPHLVTDVSSRHAMSSGFAAPNPAYRMQSAIHRMDWGEASEGYYFWRDLANRYSDISIHTEPDTLVCQAHLTYRPTCAD